MTISLSEIITRGDFVRIYRHGPEDLREHLWFYRYKEGLIDIPLNWHLAFFKIDIGELLLPWIKWGVDSILRFVDFIISLGGER